MDLQATSISPRTFVTSPLLWTLGTLQMQVGRCHLFARNLTKCAGRGVQALRHILTGWKRIRSMLCQCTP